MGLKRMTSWLVSIFMIAGMLPAAGAAGAELALTVPDKLPAAGQSFSATVELKNNPGVNAVQFELMFNKSAVTCTKITNGPILRDMLSASNPDTSSGAKIAAAGLTTATADGKIATFDFTVKNPNINADFALDDVILSDIDGNSIAYSITLNGKAGSTGGNSGSTGGSSGSTTAPSKPDITPDVPDTNPTTPDTGAVSTEKVFSDVPSTYWAHDSISKAAKQGIVSGYTDGTFGPDKRVTRAQFVTMLWNLAGKPDADARTAFTDVPDTYWGAKQIAWAAKNGYVTGKTISTFEPESNITREQAVAILFRYSGGQSGAELGLTGIYDAQFTDSGRISGYAKNAVYWAVYNGVVSGVTDKTIVPGGYASRAQTAVMFLRYADKIA